MKFPKLFGTGKKAEETQNAVESSDREETEEVSRGTKVKVVAALFVVAFATYVAYWVQEPTDNIKADVLSSTQETSATVESAVSTEFATTESAVTPSGTELVADAIATSTQEVSIIDFSFNPANLQVAKGTKVIWTNKDSVPHTVTGDTFTSTTLNSGDAFEHTFMEDGTFKYSCSFHPQMKGSVQVGEVAGSTQATSEMVMGGTEAVTPTEQLLPAAMESAIVEQAVMTPMPELISAINANSDQLVNAASETGVSRETMATHGAADEKGRMLSKSGPEQIVYLGIFLAILYFNRRKLTRFTR